MAINAKVRKRSQRNNRSNSIRSTIRLERSEWRSCNSGACSRRSGKTQIPIDRSSTENAPSSSTSAVLITQRTVVAIRASTSTEQTQPTFRQTSQQSANPLAAAAPPHWLNGSDSLAATNATVFGSLLSSDTCRSTVSTHTRDHVEHRVVGELGVGSFRKVGK